MSEDGPRPAGTVRIGPLPGLRLSSTARAFPGPPLSAAEAARLHGAAHDGELLARLGVEHRHWIGAHERPAELGARALAAALAAGPAPELLLVATATPEHATRSLAASVLEVLGLDLPALDLRAGGAGGLVAWIQAVLHLHAGLARVALLAVETTSRFLDRDDPTALLYGDGAVALVLERAPGHQGALEAAWILGRRLAGAAFSVPGVLDPRNAPGTFRRPDRAYLEDLARLRTELTSAVGEPRGTRLAYPVTRAGVEAECSPGPAREAALASLREHGCLGCAGVLDALVELREARDAASTGTLELLAAGGGGHGAALRWRTSPIPAAGG